MRWLPFFILAYIILGLQLGLSGYAQYRGAAPNLGLLAVVFISLNAPRDQALLGSFLLGAMQDLVTLQPMGLYAFIYGLVAMLINTLAQVAYRQHPLTQFVMALIGGVLAMIILWTHGRIHPLGLAMRVGDQAIPPVRPSPRLLAVSVMYTALLAPIVLGILQRIDQVFGFQSSRRRIRSLTTSRQ